MPKIIVLYASETGNTEDMAEKIAEGVRETGLVPVVKDAYDATARELADYDGILFGSGTIGDGELPDEALDICEDLDPIDLKGRLAATFGSGDTMYDLFCEAVNIISSKLGERGAEIVLPGFKVDLEMSDSEIIQAREFGRKFAEAVIKRKESLSQDR